MIRYIGEPSEQSHSYIQGTADHSERDAAVICVR